MTIPDGYWIDASYDTAGLWFVTDNDDINILPLSIEACYYVTGTSDVTISVA